MEIEYVTKRFSKTGRGIPQVPLLADDGSPVLDDKGKPVVGNEQYTAEQIVEESVKGLPLEDFVSAALAACGGDEATFKTDWVAGANHRMRLSAGGSSPVEKAARDLVKRLGIPYEQALAVVQSLKK
jgi:hypothetical protein